MNVVFLLELSDSISLGLARSAPYRFVADAVKHMKSGDRNAVIAFGEAGGRRPSAGRPGNTVDRPKAQIDGRGTNLFQAIQLGLAVLPPGFGEPHRQCSRRAPERRQRPGRRAGGQGRPGADIHLRGRAADLHPGSRRRGDGAPARR